MILWRAFVQSHRYNRPVFFDHVVFVASYVWVVCNYRSFMPSSYVRDQTGEFPFSGFMLVDVCQNSALIRLRYTIFPQRIREFPLSIYWCDELVRHWRT